MKSVINGLNKKQKIADSVAQFFHENGMSFEQGIECCKSSARKFAVDWLFVLSSDWLSPLLFQYLTLKDISMLDVAICNRNGRPQWLKSLEKHFSFTSSDSLDWSNLLVEWIIVRKLHFEKLRNFRFLWYS